MKLTVFKCVCGKAHLCMGVTHTSKCTCGQSLWDIMWKVGH